MERRSLHLRLWLNTSRFYPTPKTNRADYEKWKAQAAQQQQQSNQAAQEVKKHGNHLKKDSFRRHHKGRERSGHDNRRCSAEARQQLMEHLNYRADAQKCR